MWHAFTNIGDAAVTLPVAIVCAGWIAMSNLRLAFRWGLVLSAGMALVGATKILYAGWGVSFPEIEFRVISGHTMLATSVWTVTIALLLRSWGLLATVGVVGGLIVGACTGLARVFDHSHSLSEVAIGWVVGAVVGAVFLRACVNAKLEQFRPMAVTITLLVVSTLAYGHTTPFQRLIDGHSPAIRARAAADVARVF
jgi:membrane-associated phospholipid phosphatase